MLASSSQDDILAEMEIVSWGMNAIKEAVKNYLADFSPKEVPTPHNGRKSLILAPQEIPDISGYQLGFGSQCVKAYNNENPVTYQKIL